MAGIKEYPNRRFGQRSQTNLKGVHPDLVKVVTRALMICEVDFTAIDGLRTLDQQRILYGQGRTAKQLVAAGYAPAMAHKLAKPREKQVTWTLNSKHRPQKDGFSHAVDLVFITGTTVHWDAAHKIAEAMFAAAAELSVPITWGHDWNRNGKRGEKGENDTPHYELYRHPGAN